MVIARRLSRSPQSDKGMLEFSAHMELRVFFARPKIKALEINSPIPQNCQVPTALEIEAFRAALEPAFGVRFSAPSAARATFYDTFEWGVWFGNRLLYQGSGQLRLCERDNHWIGDVRHSVPTTAKHAPRFEWEYGEGGFRRELKRLAGLRALLPVARVSMREQPVEVLNEIEKTVFRFEIASFFADTGSEEPFFRLCHFRPMRGYEAEAIRAIEMLRTIGAAEMREGPLAIYFREQGTIPRPYTLRPEFDLRRDLPAREAVRRIIHRILGIARENEAGMLEDIDTEFLHDYRICVRKIRSLLSLIKGIYPEAKTAELKAAFAQFFEVTNRLRDLDVFLQAREQYLTLLPASVRPAIEELFRDFAKERRRALRKVVGYLSSSTYSREVEAAENFFARPAELPETEVSQRSIGPLVAQTIFRSYRRIVKIERSLGEDTPDEAMHQVRIQCKRLRYMIEFFSELLPAEQTESIEKQLRRLQTTLGLFNDYSIQQRALFQYWERKRKKSGNHEELAFALGGLVAVLNKAQQDERDRFHQTLDEFCAPQIARAVKSAYRDSGVLAADSTEEAAIE
jgi:CHAD domain-containing protein